MTTCKLIRKSEAKTSVWAGGTTTELFIYPESSDYKARDFEVRLSSATVDLESSDFTSLPGFTRHIMPLDGSMRLVHEGQHECALKPYETDTFSGSWNTKSYGRCVDFNLMYSGDWDGSLNTLYEPQKSPCTRDGITALYARADGISVTVTDNGLAIFSGILNKGDFLAIIGKADKERDTGAELEISEIAAGGVNGNTPLAVLASADRINADL